MTMAEVKSIEETLIKISVKTLYFIGAALVGSTFFVVILYTNIIASQEMILNEVKKNAVEQNWQIQDVRKDISNIDGRITRLEK